MVLNYILVGCPWAFKVLRSTRLQNQVSFYTPIHYAWPYPTDCRPLPLPRRFSVRGPTHAWKPHILNITNKANSTLGFVKRNLHHCPQKVKDQAYKRSTLEYGCTASGIRIEHTRNHGSNRSSTGSTHRNKNLHEGGGMRNQRPKATILANSRKKKTSS